MAPVSQASHLMNPLATSEHLESAASRLDGVPKSLEDSVRFEAARLIQAAGIILRLPQEIIVQSIVLLQRFWLGADGGSLLEHDPKDVIAAALFLAAKPSSHPVSPRHVLTSFAYLSSLETADICAAPSQGKLGSSWQLSNGEYEIARNTLYDIEAHMLHVLGFQTHVAVPHSLCINYLQTLDVFQTPLGSAMAKAAFTHLNSAVLSPQLLYLTHQPSAIATAAIYLAAKQVGLKLPEVEWWEVFDLDREDLGFLVVALRSVQGFAEEHDRTFEGRRVPMTVHGLQLEIERMQRLDADH